MPGKRRSRCDKVSTSASAAAILSSSPLQRIVYLAEIAEFFIEDLHHLLAFAHVAAAWRETVTGGYLRKASAEAIVDGWDDDDECYNYDGWFQYLLTNKSAWSKENRITPLWVIQAVAPHLPPGSIGDMLRWNFSAGPELEIVATILDAVPEVHIEPEHFKLWLSEFLGLADDGPGCPSTGDEPRRFAAWNEAYENSRLGLLAPHLDVPSVAEAADILAACVPAVHFFKYNSAIQAGCKPWFSTNVAAHDHLKRHRNPVNCIEYGSALMIVFSRLLSFPSLRREEVILADGVVDAFLSVPLERLEDHYFYSEELFPGFAGKSLPAQRRKEATAHASARFETLLDLLAITVCGLGGDEGLLKKLVEKVQKSGAARIETVEKKQWGRMGEEVQRRMRQLEEQGMEKFLGFTVKETKRSYCAHGSDDDESDQDEEHYEEDEECECDYDLTEDEEEDGVEAW